MKRNNKCSLCDKPDFMMIGRKKYCLKHYKEYLKEMEKKHELPKSAKRK
jgi:hypothetical protein